MYLLGHDPLATLRPECADPVAVRVHQRKRCVDAAVALHKLNHAARRHIDRVHIALLRRRAAARNLLREWYIR